MKVIKKIELTESQKGIYFDCQLDPVSYNISASILLYDLKEEHFENAFELLIRSKRR